MAKDNTLSASLEDYIEAIYLVSKEKGSARSRDITARLGVTGPSVTEALRQLDQKGLINYAPYEAITLTREGAAVARDVYHRHATLKLFFMEVLGLDEELADEGACKMEHAASANIIERVIQYTRFVREERNRPDVETLPRFNEYLQANQGKKSE